MSIDLEPMTFIVGPNGSGKSSVLMAVQLLKQSIGTQLNFNGEFVDLGSFNDVLYSKAKDETLFFDEKPLITLEVGVRPSKTESEILRPLLKTPLVSEQFSSLKEIGYRVSFDGIQTRQEYLVNQKEIFGFGFLEIRNRTYGEKIFLPNILENASCTGTTQILDASRLTISYPNMPDLSDKTASFLEALHLMAGIVRKQIEMTYYISVLRQPSMETARQGYFPKWVGRDGQHTVGLLALIFGSREYEQTRNKISKWANAFGFEELRAGWRGQQELSADFKDPKTQGILKVTAAGHGSVQMLPVITQLFWSEVGSTVSFEEPEVSLHLELVGKLPAMFSEVVREGKQLIITTHNQNVLFALRPIVAGRELSVEKIAILELKKSDQGSVAQKLQLTPEGAIKGGISSFIEAQRNMIYQWSVTIPPTDENGSQRADKDEQSGSTDN
jgi:predicted ATPase